MNKEQFIDELKKSLNGQIHEFEVKKNITFYEEYFNNEMRNGRTEEEICEALGSPRLIARTLIDTSDIPLKDATFTQRDYDTSDYGDESKGKAKDFIFDVLFNGRTLTTFQKIIFTLLAVSIVGIIFTVLSFIVRIFVMFIPIIILIAAIMIIIKIFNN